MEFLGVVANSQDMTLSLPKEKVLKIQEQYEKIPNQSLPSIIPQTLSKSIGRLVSTAVAIFSATLQFRAFHNQIQGILSNNYLEEQANFRQIKIETELVDSRFKFTQWKIFDNFSSPDDYMVSINKNTV